MRKAIYLGAALAAVMTTSCSNDMDQFGTTTGDGNVVIQLQLPDNLATRSFGDGTTATNLQYAVYHAGETNVVTQGTATFNGLQATVNLNLVNGKSYDFIFWADNDGNSFYTFDADNQTITVDYDGLKGNDETRDAFFGQLTNQEITGPATLSATLKRPFAQINLGTSDFDEVAVKAAYPVFSSSMTISTTLPNTLNLLSGEVSGETETVVTSAEGRPVGENFPVNGYEYVSMNYILVDAAKDVIDLTFSFKNEGAEISNLSVASVPVQRNYRTNIYGAVFTSPTDITIKIDPIFQTPDYDQGAWDGKTVETPVADENGQYHISTPAQLAGIAKMVKEGNNFDNNTVVLNSNMDLGGHVLKIGEFIYGTPSISYPFNGVFDGNGYTIRNFKTDESNKIQSRFGTGLFAVLKGTVKNLTISDAQIGNLANGGITYGNINGVVAGYLYGFLENVTVENCKVYGYGKLGGLAGMFEGNDNLDNRIKNCKVTNCTINGVYNLAEGVGLSHGELEMNGCEFTNNKLNHESELITVNPVIAVYEGSKGPKPASVIYGTYIDINTIYYSSGAKYYNSSRFDDYAIMIDGVKHHTDGVSINNFDGFVELPSDIKKVSDTYNELYKSGSDYYISSANGLLQLNSQWKASYNRPGILYGTTVNIMTDIDAKGKTWGLFFSTPDSNTMAGFTFNGNGHTISNLNIENGLFNGLARGHNTTNPAIFKDLTMKNCTSTGDFHVGIIGGQIYGDIALQNVKVIDCEVSGNCNVGGMLGSTTVEDHDASASFTNCLVSGCELTAEGREGSDPTGASAYVGRALNTGDNTSTITLTNSTASNNTFNNQNGRVGGGLWSSVTYDNGWKDAETHNN